VRIRQRHPNVDPLGSQDAATDGGTSTTSPGEYVAPFNETSNGSL